MKEITIKDCIDLKDKFLKYTETAEQHEFPLLLMIHLKLDNTIEQYEREGQITDQVDARAMFRVVLKIIGEDYSDYIDKK